MLISLLHNAVNSPFSGHLQSLFSSPYIFRSIPHSNRKIIEIFDYVLFWRHLTKFLAFHPNIFQFLDSNMAKNAQIYHTTCTYK